ncbi:hypothetical protein [Hymenobacter volaticus]|uniref:Uncharacterized protein n=1 Tax=Hymenobacter volaticus TaxID=2932254 RepID=A0ABY4GBH4_9BACT|nr:hypothetical protein [Hymenobacter volaticus]UOQ68260.1 hypothetical protein MUN86_10635 [Hymenobacter volaticus]
MSFVLPVIVFATSMLFGCKPITSAGIALVCISASWFVHWGTEVDITLGLQRTYYTVVGYSYGNWKPLPPIAGITLKYFSTISYNVTPSSRTSWGIWNDAKKRDEEIIIMMSVTQSSTGIIIKTAPLSELQVALEYAQGLAKQLNVPLNTYLPAHIAVE